NQVLPEPLRPDVAAVLAREVHRLLHAASDLAARLDVRRERHQRRDLRVGEHDAARRQHQDREADREPPPGFEPGFVPEHGHSSVATVSRKISFSVTGATSTDTGPSARASSRIGSAPPLAITVSTRPCRRTRATPAARNTACGASRSNTSCTRRKLSPRSPSAPARTAAPRATSAIRSAICSTSAIWCDEKKI